MTSDEPTPRSLSPEAKRAIERYRRMMANRSAEEVDASGEGNDERLLRDKPPHWG